MLSQSYDAIDTNAGGLNCARPVSFDVIAVKIDHSDGRHLTLSLPSSSTLKNLYYQVAESLSVPSVCLVHNNQTLRLDEDSQSKTLKQLNFSSDQIELLESYPVTRKLRIFIQTSTSSAGRRSSLSSKREYSMVETDRFESILNTYRRDMKSTNIRFEFDGEIIHPQATPTDYEIVDGDILDAFILPTPTQSSDEQTARPKAKPKAREILFDEDSDN